MIKHKFLLILVLTLICKISALDPTKQIQLYPNTENSDSIYIFSFKLQNNIPANSYILINLDWYSSALLPYRCIMVNETLINLACTNLNAPTFPLTITEDVLKLNNKYLTFTKTVAVLLKNNLNKNYEYKLQLHLYNIIPNIRKISQSAEIYVVSSEGLVYQQNINYGPAINRPPIDIVLQTSILNDMSTNQPGSLSTFKAQFTITTGVSTSLSAFTIVMHYPFSFTLGSIARTYASQMSQTNPIPLYSAPVVKSYMAISPNIFYVVFNQSFGSGRRFILQITQITNPFFIAQSNISIYSMNYNSLTPLEGFQHGYPIKTVSFSLPVVLNFPYNQPAIAPRQFYKNVVQYAKVDVTVLYSAIPTAYAIRIVITGGTISAGTAWINLPSLTYTPVYVYGSNYIIIKSMGPIPVGSILETTFKFLKNSVTVFSFAVYIDTQQVITTFTASSYLYYGLVQGTSVNKANFLANFYDSVFGRSWWISNNPVLGSSDLYIQIYPQSYQPTSTGSYIQIYLTSNFVRASNFNSNTDCRFNNVANSAICTLEISPSYLKIKMVSNDLALNPFPITQSTFLYIRNIYPTRAMSNQVIFPCYFMLYKNNAPGSITYSDHIVVSVLPKYNGLTNLKMEQHGNVYDQDYTYPGFLRVQSTTPSQMSYVLQENQIRVIILIGRYGFAGMGAIANQGKYPCTSNLDVECTYLQGHADQGSLMQLFQWDKIVIKFPNGGENSNVFHVIVPDSVVYRSGNYYYHFVGKYNLLTKDYMPLYMKDYYYRSNWNTGPININTNLYIDMGGKAGSYRSNVTVYVSDTGSKTTTDFTFLCISTSWSFYEKGSSINAGTLSGLTDPSLGFSQASPVSVYMGGGMYLTVIGFKYNGAAPNSFSIQLDNVHMPYDYDLPSYYIYLYNGYDTNNNGNNMQSSNQFKMTNAGIFYGSPLKSLTIQCLDNGLGVMNTICTIIFGTQNPLIGNGRIVLVFSGMTISSDVCQVKQQNGTIIPCSCSSTPDNLNLTIILQGTDQYVAGNFTATIQGVGIDSTQISQSFTLYLYDSNGLYVIQSGNRILTTTIAQTKVIEVNQILYSYSSPLAYNKMSVQFYLPRQIYADQYFNFIMGKDLTDVNTEIKRLNIVITRGDGVQLSFLFKLISSQYKVVFSFDDPTQLIAANYTMQIYGIRTPASFENGNFNITFQRGYDQDYTLVTTISSAFPSLSAYNIGNMAITSYFNTQGYNQQIDITITNKALPVNNQMQWIVNFPSYYSPLIFNLQPYCLINGSPITCVNDPNTPYQLIISNSPRIIPAGTSYQISVLGIACPRNKYMGGLFPNSYLFIGILQNSLVSAYAQTTLLYPQQNVYTNIAGIISLVNIQVSSTTLISFSNAYMTLNLQCNIAISQGQYLYLQFPPEFDNFNNIALNVIIQTTTVLGTTNAPVLNRRVEILMPSNIAANAQIYIQMTNVPTPTIQCSSQMSQIVSYITTSDKLMITAASATSANSAPQLYFVKAPKYISFNGDQQVVITAGTYSPLIPIRSSNAQPFLTNVMISLSSTGFKFEPAQVLLKLGDTESSFRIAADKDLYPISYFYSAIKQEQVTTYYQITTNNNIRITNTPVAIVLPSSISIPRGGCSAPLLIKLPNPPMIDMSITFNYNNSLWDGNSFFPNPHTSRSAMTFSSIVDNNTLSFCTSANISGSSMPVTFVLTGTNYNSYTFSPSAVVTFNVINLPATPTPTMSINMINQQKTFVDFNITQNVDGILYYELYIGDSSADVLSSQDIQVQLKQNNAILQSMSDFMHNIYLQARDQRIGQIYQIAGQHTIRFTNMLPQTPYVLCVYLQNSLSIMSGPFCNSIKTQNWGYAQILQLKFSKTLSDYELNKVLCFFTKQLNTTTSYLVDSEGNSCNNNAVANINFGYSSTTFTNQKKSTKIYLVTNPLLTSDPASMAFTNLFNTDKALSSSTLSAALGGYGIDFMTGSNVKTSDAISFTYRTSEIGVSFTAPVYNSINGKITISDVMIDGTNPGSIYFVLVLYKQFLVNPTTNQTSVKIRLNSAPTPWQVVNCLNWQNITAEGCARAVYTGTPVTVTLSSIQPNSMYLLYYIGSNEYPFRPIVGYQVNYQTVVTLVYSNALIFNAFILLFMAFFMSL